MTDSKQLPANISMAFCQAIIDELIRCGVKDICLCPGSRSAPLAIAAANRKELQTRVHLDERSAAFFALGLAKSQKVPVALLCTSGTAAANFLPAIIEAHYSRIPLLVLTADRPAEMRGWGVPQTIDQTHIYSRYVAWFAEAPLPECSTAIFRAIRSLACRAVIEASSLPARPVHLNVPLREPLDPGINDADQSALSQIDPVALYGRDKGEAYIQQYPQTPLQDSQCLRSIVSVIASAKRGVMVCGVNEAEDVNADQADKFAELIDRFSAYLGWPVLADVCSQVRFGVGAGMGVEDSRIISYYDLFLRDYDFAARLKPDVVLLFGSQPISKSLRLWLQHNHQAKIILLDADRRWPNADQLVSLRIECLPSAFIQNIMDELKGQHCPDSLSPDPLWLELWRTAENSCKNVIHRLKAGTANSLQITEAQIGACLIDMLSNDCALFLSNSMPIRDLDSFSGLSAKNIAVFCNRGANGIDGILSTALGLAAGRKNGKPTVLLTGDLAFLHDIGGLLAARKFDINLTIVVINNDGGGIFSFLPIARFAQETSFNELFTSPHGVDLALAAQLYSLNYQCARTLRELKEMLDTAFQTSGTRIIEVPVDIDSSTLFHKEIILQLSRELHRDSSGNSYVSTD